MRDISVKLIRAFCLRSRRMEESTSSISPLSFMVVGILLYE
jgi:hypothetical protein